MRSLTKILIAIMILILSMGVFAGCGDKEASSTPAGTLILKVNPEFEIDYDEKGNVVAVMPMNEDAGNLMQKVEAYEGRPVNLVLPQLVKLMDEKGLIEKDAEGNGKDINIEVKYGSMLPSDDFLDKIILNVKGLFDDKNITGKVVVTGESNYGISQYDVSDYGMRPQTVNGGTTNYSDYDSATNYSNYGSATNYSSGSSGGSATNYSNYDSATNYSSGSSGGSATNYSDYDSATNYSSGGTDYDGASAYDDSDYGDSDYDD